MKKFDPVVAAFAAFAKKPDENKKIIFSDQALIDELNVLNTRWQKAMALENQGAFLSLPPEKLKWVEDELCTIVNRAVVIWDTLQAEAPELLKGLVFLEPWEGVDYAK